MRLFFFYRENPFRLFFRVFPYLVDFTSVDSLLAFFGKIEKRSTNSWDWLLTLEIWEIGISNT